MIWVSVNVGDVSIPAQVFMKDEFADIPEGSRGQYFKRDVERWALIDDVVPEDVDLVFVLFQEDDNEQPK